MWFPVVAMAIAVSPAQRSGVGSLHALDAPDFSEIEEVKKSLAKLKASISPPRPQERYASDTPLSISAEWNPGQSQGYGSLLQEARAIEPMTDLDSNLDDQSTGQLKDKLEQAERELRDETDLTEHQAKAMTALEQHAKEAASLLSPYSNSRAAGSLLETPVGGVRSLASHDYSEIENMKANLRKLSDRIEVHATPPELRAWSDARPLNPEILPAPRRSLFQATPEVFAETMAKARSALKQAVPARVTQQLADDLSKQVDTMAQRGHVDPTSFFQIEGNLQDLQSAEKSLEKDMQKMRRHNKQIANAKLGDKLDFGSSLLQSGDAPTLDDDAAAFSDDDDATPKTDSTAALAAVVDGNKAFIQRRKEAQIEDAARAEDALDAAPATTTLLVADPLSSPVDEIEAAGMEATRALGMRAIGKESAMAAEEDKDKFTFQEVSPGAGVGEWADPSATGIKDSDFTAPVDFSVDTHKDANPFEDAGRLALTQPVSVMSAVEEMKDGDAAADAVLSKAGASAGEPSGLWTMKNEFETPEGNVRPMDSWVSGGMAVE